MFFSSVASPFGKVENEVWKWKYENESAEQKYESEKVGYQTLPVLWGTPPIQERFGKPARVYLFPGLRDYNGVAKG